MNRRDFLKLTTLASVPWFVKANPRQSQKLPGRLLGLTTLDDDLVERTELFSLNLKTGDHGFKPLGNYQFGHSLEALANGHWLAIPYGDDQVDCLVLNNEGEILNSISAPEQMGFGGHGAVLPNGAHVFLHFNQSKRQVSGQGIAAIVDTRSGKVLRQTETQIMHAHDIIMAQSGHIVIADDGVIETNDSEQGAVLMQPIQPALHFFNQSLDQERSIALPINGSVVHIAEDGNNNIKGSVEQYVRRNEAGKRLFKQLLNEDPEAYFNRFDPTVFSNDVPLPAPIVSAQPSGSVVEEALTLDHQDPFDMVYNTKAKASVCVFTESNRLAVKQDEEPIWRYVNTETFGLTSPFGLASIDGTAMIAVNGFDQGLAIINAKTLELVRYHDVPTHGVKHLSYSAQ